MKSAGEKKSSITQNVNEKLRDAQQNFHKNCNFNTVMFIMLENSNKFNSLLKCLRASIVIFEQFV